MSEFNFEELVESAVANNNSKSGGVTPSYLLAIDEARAAVKIKDGNKVAKEDGSQALTVMIGRITISLDVIAPNATRVNATKDKVEAFTAKLQEALDEGVFDSAIVEEQNKANPANRVAKAKDALQREDAQETPSGLDLDALEESEEDDLAY